MSGTGARTLLIGGSGLIGGAAARALRAAGHHVTVLTRGRQPAPWADQALVADRDDAGSLAAALEGRHFDFTVDLLAYDSADVERLLTIPVASLGRYVMISTGQVYLAARGATPPHREEDRDLPLASEPPAETPDYAEWSYGAGKRRAEQTLRGLVASHGVRATALRLPIVQGANDGTLRLWAWLERMRDGGPVLRPEGAVRPVRFVWAEDVARALLRLLEGPPPRAFAYNLAGLETVPLRDFLERLARAAECTPRFVDRTWEVIDAAGIDRRAFPYAGRWVSVLHPGLAAAELGWSATPLDEWLPRVVRAHLERPPDRSHPGYAGRARELELAARDPAAAAP